MLIVKVSLKRCRCCAAAPNKEASKANTRQQGLSASVYTSFEWCLWSSWGNTCMSTSK